MENESLHQQNRVALTDSISSPSISVFQVKWEEQVNA